LSDYTRAVGLATQAKQSGVPLLGFLLAHKHQVITDHNPEVFEPMIQDPPGPARHPVSGEVKLTFKKPPVADPQPAQALNAVLARMGPGADEEGAGPTKRTVFQWQKQAFTVIPQFVPGWPGVHPGSTLAVDFVCRSGKRPALELIRYYNPAESSYGEFGKYWRLLIPCRLQPIKGEPVKVANAYFPEKMSLINQITQEAVTFTLNKERFPSTGIAYVPDQPQESQAIGIFLLKNSNFLLYDKLGNEILFDGAGRLSRFSFPNKQKLAIEYLNFTDAVEPVPLRLQPASSKTVAIGGRQLPRSFTVIKESDNSRETFHFRDGLKEPLYFPQDEGKSAYVVLVFDGTSYGLMDKRKNRYLFNLDGSFKEMSPHLPYHPVKSIATDDHTISFAYMIANDGNWFISKAFLQTKGSTRPPVEIVRFEYSQEGNLLKATGKEN